jgi:hypothetical protein
MHLSFAITSSPLSADHLGTYLAAAHSPQSPTVRVQATIGPKAEKNGLLIAGWSLGRRCPCGQDGGYR